MSLLITGATGVMGHNALLQYLRDWVITALHCPDDGSFARAAPTFGIESRIIYECESSEYKTYLVDPRAFVDDYRVVPHVTLKDDLQRLARHLAAEDAYAGV